MRNIFSEMLLTVYTIFLCVSLADGVGSYILNTFSDPSNPGDFNHLAIDKDSKTVYIGAVNSLYQLNSRLRLEKTAITGPHLDNPRCPPDNCLCTDGVDCHLYKKVLTDSVCKGLVIDYDNNNIITCSNLFQGYCIKRKLGSIDVTTSVKYHYKVPWDNTSSTVMFISDGPGSINRPVPVLYIAATRSTVGENAYKDIVPTISSRSLGDLDFAKNDQLRSKSAISIESQMRDSFRVNYVHGFGAGGFSYFTTVQRKCRDCLAYESKLVRICQTDEAYRSYVEVPLQCNFAGTSYNLAQAMYVGKTGVHVARSLKVTELVEDVLFGVFSIGHPNTARPTTRSALCMYSLKEIQNIFTKNVRACFKGIGFTGPDHLVNPQRCNSGTFTIGPAYCGLHDYNHPINGTIPVTATALKTFHSSGLSSLAVIPSMNYTAAFLGTTNGHIKKVNIESSSSAHEYEDITIDQGSKVNPDMLLSDNNNYLYVMTKRKLSRVKVEDCNRYTTCQQCLGAKDPFCGWCSLENRCTTYGKCPEAAQTWRWLPAPSGVQCTTITSIQPSQVQIERGVTSTLRLSIQNLPVITNSNYECAFSGYNKVAESAAYKTSTGVKCLTPYYNMLPPIPDKQDHIIMKLAVRVNGRAFVSRNFTFFDCTVHQTCTGCTSSAYPCTWCIKHHKCVHKSEICSSDVLVTGKNVPNSDRPGPLNCPKIEADFTEVLVPSDTRKAVVVKAKNLEIFQSDLICHFHMKSGTVEVRAIHEGAGSIRCTEITFSYSEHVGSMNVPFRITWGPEKHALDNPLNIKVKVYKCSAMASDCGTCLTLDAKYYCGWCDPVCSIGTPCNGNFLSSTATCPNPRIIRFYPNSGPVLGGTNLTIEGVNLGKIERDVSVKVANYGCRITKYIKARKIICETTASSTPVVGPVVVTVESKYSGQSSNAFYYVIPKIRNISPLKGPLSGGTRLTLIGNDMNAGSDIRASIIGLPCRIISTSQEATVCVTSPAMVQTSGPVHATFDGYEVQYTNHMFRYVDDPTVLQVEREKAIVSGGVKIRVRGSNLDAVQNTQMYMLVGGREYTNKCRITSQTELICLSPDLSEAGLQFVEDEPEVQVTYGFIMQNIRVKKNDTDGGPLFTIYPNPEFERFPDGTHSFQTRNIYLTINGKNINSALKESDVTVQIGDGFCDVTSVASSQLTCRPPEKQPKSIGGGGGNPKVKIIVGTNLTFDLGHLTYDKPDSYLSNTVIISIAVGAGVLILIIILVGIAYRRKVNERDRVMKKMQKEMDVLECRVAKECKEAFAELQTDMTELTSDLSGVVGIPFLPYRSFCIQILFPTCDEFKHPITRDIEFGGSRKDQTERGLKLFEQLIHNKTFLLLFIRTLESSKSFTMRDKVNVASLISVSLHCNMMYYTDILKTLLAELIEKSMEGRNNPKLLLRRTDSVGEKMLTNWFAFLLYRFLKECVGEPLFMVFQAIKQQVSKGPVDAISSEAKYSLSEDKLIRQQVDYRQMTLNVIDYDLQYGSQEHPVRVLDVDTISQVKEKILDAIYKNAPFSVRPNKDDSDLEWRTGVQGRIVLSDQDMTSKMDGDFRRLNTLAHYKVPDGALMALVRRVNPTYSVAYMPDKITMSPRYENLYANSSPQMNCSLSPSSMTTLHHIDIDNNIRHYHLVKQHDNDNQKEGDRGSKMVSEIYLTRLLSTKGTLQQFVDDLFETIFSTAHRGSALPLAIKYLFDFLDDQAIHHGITDPEVVHTWKSNSLPLRFWVNVIKNPNFVFDVYKSNIVDSCLSVIAQTFMDSCSMKDHRLGKDSPSSKLLYAKDIPKYKKWVERYYQDIKMTPAISDQDMAAELGETTKYSKDFNVVAALNELYSYVVRYNDQLMRNLEEDEFAKTYKLAIKLEQVHSCMESKV